MDILFFGIEWINSPLKLLDIKSENDLPLFAIQEMGSRPTIYMD